MKQKDQKSLDKDLCEARKAMMQLRFKNRLNQKLKAVRTEIGASQPHVRLSIIL